MRLRQLFENLARTGEKNTAVVGWGRGMGHKGHMMLASSVLTYSDKIGGDPYFVVSRTYGPDDPLQPEEKLSIYKRVFPDSSHIFQTATDELPDLTRVLTNLNQQGYNNVTVVVGADQVTAFQYLKQYNGKPNKKGEVPFNFDSLDVISRQETGDPSAGEEGPRATPMRQVLTDPSKSEREQFAVWRDAMSPEIDDDTVMDLMRKAKERMAQMTAAKPKKKVKEMRLYELEQPSGTLYIVFKLDNTGNVRVVGDFGTRPQEVVQKANAVGIKDKKGGKVRPLRVNFLFTDATTAIQELEDSLRDVDFIGAEKAQFVFPPSVMRSEQGPELYQIKDYIEQGGDERYKLYVDKEPGEPDRKASGVDHFVVGPDGKRHRVAIPGKPNTQMGGHAVAQPDTFKYTLLKTDLLPKLRSMGFKFDGNQIILRADQRDKLKNMLGTQFQSVFGQKGMFKQ